LRSIKLEIIPPLMTVVETEVSSSGEDSCYAAKLNTLTS
jgi:hypothetical protein